MVTGEALPVEKATGAKLIGGTLNGRGGFVMRAEKVGKETMLARIVQMVAEAQRSRARSSGSPTGSPAGSCRRWSRSPRSPSSRGGPSAPPRPGVRPDRGRLRAHHRLPLRARPGHAHVDHGRRRPRRGLGVLIKNAEALERLEKVDTLVVDKTGTLTEGRPTVTAVVPFGGHDEADLLRLAATLERASEHPLAAAIVRAAEERGVAPGAAGDFRSVTGKGVAGTVDGVEVALGNRAMMEEAKVDVAEAARAPTSSGARAPP
jgi:Cu+-exporting ATPase